MAGQAHSALGTAKIVTGDVHERKAIWRIDQTAPEGRYTLDNAARHFGDEGPRVRRGARAASRAQAPFLRRARGRVRAVPCPLKDQAKRFDQDVVRLHGGAIGGEADSGKLSSSYVVLPIVFPYLISPSSFCLSY